MDCPTGKVGHLTYEQAEHAVKRLKSWHRKNFKNKGTSPQPYRCQQCRQWHVGNGSDKRRQTALSARKIKWAAPNTKKGIHLMTPEEIRERIEHLLPGDREGREAIILEFVEFCTKAAPPHIKFIAVEILPIVGGAYDDTES